MSSLRKKQDEKNLKTLRDLGTLPHNKYCFDCNQRGPTYVNVTIGSFVCTKCSGMLRGLTPPHRVKSISMATFTSDEIELLKKRGNDYCKRVWLGLHDDNLPTMDCRDEQTIRDFMVDKYEKKRFYLDPSQALKNGYTNGTAVKVTPLVSAPKPIKATNGVSSVDVNTRKRPEVPTKTGEFTANFDNMEFFGFKENRSNNLVNNNSHREQKASSNAPQAESFANFDDNPVFTNNSNGTVDFFKLFDLKYPNNSGSVMNEVPLVPKYCDSNNTNINRWSLPIPAAFDTYNFADKNANNNGSMPAPPAADKYAALKDLDNAFKTQTTVDWNSSGSNGSLYSSPTPTGSVYSSSSPQGSMFGSPSQGQFMNPLHPNNDGSSNPFNGNNAGSDFVWSNGASFGAQRVANPFADPAKVNGVQIVPAIGAGASATWGVNPFKVGAVGNASFNPFL